MANRKRKKLPGRDLGGNRCGHEPSNPRSFSHLVNRGPDGHPPVIGEIVALLDAMYYDRSILKSWQNSNPSSRRKRSEMRSAALAVGQFLFTNWFQLETRRCATPCGPVLQVPDAYYISNAISKIPEWKDVGLSVGRIDEVFSEWNNQGYMTSNQVKELLPDGSWRSSFTVRCFTRKFFVELGGVQLWDKVIASGAMKLERIRAQASALGLDLQTFLNPGKIVSPSVFQRLQKKLSKKLNISYRKRSEDKAQVDPEAVRATEDYKLTLFNRMTQLFAQHLDGRPKRDPDRWSPEEIRDNARRIVDKLFGLA